MEPAPPVPTHEPPAAPVGPAPPAPTREPRRWLRIARSAAEAVVVALAVGGLGLWCSIPDTARLATENPTSTAFIDLRREQAESDGKPFKLHWQWRSLTAISRYLRTTVVDAEDGSFYRHEGVDWNAIEHAAEANWERGAIAIGGSTITQQLAKNLYLSPSRSIIRKLREILIAFSLEDHLTKQRILELYLNVAEWGDGVFGAEAAARTWFHHSASALTASEAARLAVALPNPITRAPTVRDPELTRKAVRLVRMLRMRGLVDAAQERTALDDLGAHNERVLPDRNAARPGADPPAPVGAAAGDQSQAPPRDIAEPSAPSTTPALPPSPPPTADQAAPATPTTPPPSPSTPPSTPSESASPPAAGSPPAAPEPPPDT